jgi:hypothetical protein
MRALSTAAGFSYGPPFRPGSVNVFAVSGSSVLLVLRECGHPPFLFIRSVAEGQYGPAITCLKVALSIEAAHEKRTKTPDNLSCHGSMMNLN